MSILGQIWLGIQISESLQWRSQSTEKVTHIKGRLLDQAVILLNSVPFRNGNFSSWKEFAPRGSEFFPVRVVPYGLENRFYHIMCPPLNVTIFITHVRNCVMGATPMLRVIMVFSFIFRFVLGLFIIVFAVLVILYIKHRTKERTRVRRLHSK